MPQCQAPNMAFSSTNIASSSSNMASSSSNVASSATTDVAPSAAPSRKVPPTPRKRLPLHPTKRLLRSQSLPVYTDGRMRPAGEDGAPRPPGVDGEGDESCVVLGDHGSGVSGGVFSDMLGPLPSEILAEANNDRAPCNNRKPPTRDTRATIMQHYYPEGGWGWVVVFVATAMHILNHGLHTGYGALLGITIARFSQQPTLVGEHLRKPFTDINPFKKIPVVQDGDIVLLESCAGLRFIASKYDASGVWYPGKVEVRSKVDEYLDWQHLNTRAHGMGYFRNKVLMPSLKKCEPDMAVVREHEKELQRVERQFARYFLGPTPFITGDQVTIGDLLAACEFEQPLAGGYNLSPPIREFITRVKEKVGPDYDEVHTYMRQLAKKCLA